MTLITRTKNLRLFFFFQAIKLDLDYLEDKVDNDVSKISTIGSSSIRSAGLSGSNYSGFSGTTAVSSGEDLTLIKKQKHELELKLKEEVCYFLEIYSAILS